MNGRIAKSIRNNMYYPKERKYQVLPNGQVIANPERQLYQSLKKKYLKMWREKK